MIWLAIATNAVWTIAAMLLCFVYYRKGHQDGYAAGIAVLAEGQKAIMRRYLLHNPFTPSGVTSK